MIEAIKPVYLQHDVAHAALQLQRWWVEIQDKVASLCPRYSEDIMLRHYEHVSSRLLQATGDWDLALAGYLHGIADARVLNQVLQPEQRDIPIILDGRRRMMSLDPNDPEVSGRLITGFLPQMRDLRSLILLVVEALHHADAEDVMGKFSRSFDVCPLDLPRDFPVVPRLDSGITDARFLTAVIAPACEHLGLLRERNLAEDIALIQTNRSSMEEWLGFVREQRVAQERERRLALIQSALNGVDGVDVVWRWHHISSFARRLGSGSSFGKWQHKVSLWSRIVVRCQSALQCYEVLGKLSVAEEFEKHQRDFADHLAEPKPTGYQAIRTTVLHSTPGEAGTLMTVEILPLSIDEGRLRPLNLVLPRNAPQDKLEVQEQLQVFSPDGRMYPLPVGSKVLNFASAVHGDLVAWAQGAYVNRTWVDLLHPLQSGDIVQVDVGRTLRKELPPGWEERVPVPTRRRIRQGHREALRKFLVDLGREQLRLELRKVGIDYAEELADAALDSYVDEAAKLITRAPGLKDEGVWWLNQFGMFNEKVEPTTWLTIDRGHIDQFVRNLVSLLQRSPRLERNTVTIPQNQPQQFDEIEICEICHPGPGRKVVGAIDGRKLILHRAASDCGAGGFSVEWRHVLLREQTFVIEGSNRVGLAADILACVARREVDIIDHAGVNLGTSWAIFRFRVHGIAPMAIVDLANEIKSVHGVTRVFRPGDEIPPTLANALPRLDPVRALLSKTIEPPYLCSDQDILDDSYFYGRQNELREFSKAMDMGRRTQHRGLIAFVTGPLKFGKTSFVNRVIRETRVQDPACAVARAQCPFGRGWRETEEALLRNLKEEARAHADRRGLVVPEEAVQSIPRLVQFFHQSMGRMVLLFIDEAMRMFFASTGKEEKAGLTDFLGWVGNTQGVFLVLAGPKASERYLALEYRSILDKTIRIDMKPLDAGDILSLLRAENLCVKDIGIQALSSQAFFMVKETGGNPFWTNLIANIAWEGARRKQPFILQTRMLREASLKALDERETAFEDRFCDPVWNQRATGIARSTLLLLAGLDSSQKMKKMRSVSYSAILHHCREQGLCVTDEELESVLSDLQDRGTIQQPKQPASERSYEFTAAILREFLVRRREYAEALWQKNLEQN